MTTAIMQLGQMSESVVGVYTTPVAGGILITIIGIVTRLWLKSESRHAEELRRIAAVYQAEIDRSAAEAERQAKRIAALNERVDALEAELDQERQSRHAAEDAANARMRQYGGGTHARRELRPKDQPESAGSDE